MHAQLLTENNCVTYPAAPSYHSVCIVGIGVSDISTQQLTHCNHTASLSLFANLNWDAQLAIEEVYSAYAHMPCGKYFRFLPWPFTEFHSSRFYQIVLLGEPITASQSSFSPCYLRKRRPQRQTIGLACCWRYWEEDNADDDKETMRCELKWECSCGIVENPLYRIR